jgi:RHS repeat-associated protein
MGYWYQDTAYSALSHTAAYTYDTVNRLSAAVATGNSAYNLTFNYKADGSNGQYGNMSCVQNGNTNGLCPQWTFGAGTNQITSSGFVYDAAGNLTTDVSGPYTRNYTWDAEGRLTQVKDNGGGTSTTYAYNALGQRAELVTTGWQLEGLFDTQGERVGYYSVASSGNVWLAAYVPFRGQELAEYSTGTSFAFMHTNALGSATMATMAWGAPGNDILYYPWGQEWQQLGGMYNTHFASMHAALQGSSLIDFTMYEATNRFYASNLGRWHSPDPLGGDITNPQSLNRYAYVMNNPTSMIDPTGLDGNGPCYEYYCAPSYGGPPPGSGPPQCWTSWCPGPNGGWVWNEPNPIGSQTAAAQAGYASWVNAMWQTGGSYTEWGVHGPVTYTVGWSMDSGAFWIGPNGVVLSNEAVMEAGLPALLGPGQLSALMPGALPPMANGTQTWVQAPQQPPQKRGSYWDYIGCAASEFINQGFGSEDAAFATVGLNVAPFFFASTGAVPLACVSAGIAAFYDIKLALNVRATCRKEVYGQ